MQRPFALFGKKGFPPFRLLDVFFSYKEKGNEIVDNDSFPSYPFIEETT